MDIIEYLVKQGILENKQGNELKQEAQRLGKSQEDILLEKNILEEKKLFQLKSQFLKIPLKKIVAEEISQDVSSIIPKESIEFYKIVPFNIKKKERILEVGMVYPENNQAQEALKFFARQQKLSLNFLLITPSDFQSYFNQYGTPEKEVKTALQTLAQEEILTEREIFKKKIETKDFERLIEEPPIIKMVTVILRQAVEGNASDIHIEPTENDLRVRFRLDGVLYSSLILPIRVHPAIVARIKILSHLKIDETRIPQDGRFSARIGGKRVDFRVATLPTTLGETVVLRVLAQSEGFKDLEALGLRGRNLEIMDKVLQKTFGMILATGPSGSGKTTTLYSILNLLNKDSMNIITLEDPVEYFISGVNQSQINPDIDYTFSRGLRHILRQSPDIIMVGEIRDEETASLAVHAALTGHLVLSTLHTTNAAGVIPRLVDMGIKPFLISPSIRAMIGQRLIRVLCPFCKKKVKLNKNSNKYIMEKIKELSQNLKNISETKEESLFVFEPTGCRKCNSTGYIGRIGVFEVLEMTDSLSDFIIQNQNVGAILQEARNQGMTTMEKDGILKFLDGTTSLEEVLQIAEIK